MSWYGPTPAPAASTSTVTSRYSVPDLSRRRSVDRFPGELHPSAVHLEQDSTWFGLFGEYGLAPPLGAALEIWLFSTPRNEKLVRPANLLIRSNESCKHLQSLRHRRPPQSARGQLAGEESPSFPLGGTSSEVGKSLLICWLKVRRFLPGYHYIFNQINIFRVRLIIDRTGSGRSVWHQCGTRSGILLAALLHLGRLAALLAAQKASSSRSATAAEASCFARRYRRSKRPSILIPSRPTNTPRA